MVEILQEEGYLEAFFEFGKENGFFEMADSLVETLGLDETNELNLIISRILQEDLYRQCGISYRSRQVPSDNRKPQHLK